jgi:hypothetical protein
MRLILFITHFLPFVPVIIAVNEGLEYSNDLWNANSAVDNSLESEIYSSSWNDDDYIDESFATNVISQTGACLSSFEEEENHIFSSNDITLFSRDEKGRAQCLPPVIIGEEAIIDAETLQLFKDPESLFDSLGGQTPLTTENSSSPPKNPKEEDLNPQPYISSDNPQKFNEEIKELGWTPYKGPVQGRIERGPRVPTDRVTVTDDQKSWCRIPSSRPFNPFLIHLCCDGLPWGEVGWRLGYTYYYTFFECKHSRLFTYLSKPFFSFSRLIDSSLRAAFISYRS